MSGEKLVPVEIGEDERFPDYHVKLLDSPPDETRFIDVQTYIPASLLQRWKRAEENYNAVSEEIAEYHHAAVRERYRAKRGDTE